MRLAIQISGEFRKLYACLPTLETFVKKTFPPDTEIDYFVHTWRTDISENSIDMEVSSHGMGLSVFEPRSYVLDSYENLAFLHSRPKCHRFFYSIHKVNEIRRELDRLTDTTYDLVMRYRTDCIFGESLYACIEPYLKEKKSFLCIPKSKRMPMCDGPIQENDDSSICDWFAIGTPDTMDVYCSTFLTFQSTDIEFMAESMLSFQLRRAGITEETVLKRPEFDFYLLRTAVK